MGSWERTATMHEEQKGPTGEPVFNYRVKVKALKKRFEDYMDFVKQEENIVPFRSGCDNESAPNDTLQGLEDIYNDYMSFKSQSQSTKAAENEKKNQDRVGAEMLRKAAIGEFLEVDKDDKSNSEDEDSVSIFNPNTCKDNNDVSSIESPPAKKAKTVKKRSVSSASSKRNNRAVGGPNLEGLKQLVQLREERHTLNHQFKTERLQQSKQKLELEQGRLQLERERFEVERQERQANAALIAAVA